MPFEKQMPKKMQTSFLLDVEPNKISLSLSEKSVSHRIFLLPLLLIYLLVFLGRNWKYSLHIENNRTVCARIVWIELLPALFSPVEQLHLTP